MFKKTLIAVAAFGILAAGSLSASASGPRYGGPGYGAPHHGAAAQFGGPGWNITIGTPGFRPHYPRPRPHRVCEPRYERVWWWAYGKRHSRVIKVGETCRWVHPRPYHRPPPPVWGPAW